MVIEISIGLFQVHLLGRKFHDGLKLSGRLRRDGAAYNENRRLTPAVKL